MKSPLEIQIARARGGHSQHDWLRTRVQKKCRKGIIFSYKASSTFSLKRGVFQALIAQKPKKGYLFRFSVFDVFLKKGTFFRCPVFDVFLEKKGCETQCDSIRFAHLCSIKLDRSRHVTTPSSRCSGPSCPSEDSPAGRLSRAI